MSNPGEASGVTVILERAAAGDPRAASELLPLVYDELRKLAASRMAGAGPGQTLQPTALVHEAYARLVTGGTQDWNGRSHFFGAAAQAMRNVLVDAARRRGAEKRGGGRRRVGLDDALAGLGDADDHALEVDELLAKLERDDPGRAELVSLKVFAGLTNEQIAAIRGCSERTVERQWRFLRAWLATEWGRLPGGGEV
jgi:RNA polymerase sigma factor (TIGR02999 family)